MENTRKLIYILMSLMTISFYSFHPVIATAADQNVEPAAEAAQAGETGNEAEAEQTGEPNVEAEAMQAVETDIDMEAGQAAEPSADAVSEQTVSTGEALIEWLEAHRNIGGTVKLADHVVLEGTYSFCPDGLDMPAVFVDTDRYTITVTGTVELMSDSHLTFSGQPEGKGIFYVASGGMLSMAGVAVRSGQCAMWQEEGAGLAAGDCQISGSVHYADTPFVVDMESPCIIVEKEQTLMEVLPEQIKCTVNRQGKTGEYEQVFLAWNLEGTEKKQEERRRFQMQGSFLNASSAKPPQCTVVYNDYPLTFTDVRAFVQGGAYLFQGWYTRPEEAGAVTVTSQYSFDGEKWISCEETTEDSFLVIVPADVYGGEAQSDIYIRLKWDDGGILYFSNVLRYSADDLDDVQDIGGSRGGGTSIVNLPEKPHKSSGDKPAEDEKPSSGGTGGTDSGDVGGGNAESADGAQAPDAEPQMADAGQPQGTAPQMAAAGQSAGAEPQTTDAGQPVGAEAEGADIGQPIKAEPERADGGQPTEAGPQTAEGGQSAGTEPQTAGDGQLAEAEPEAAAAGQSAETELKNDSTVENSPGREESADDGGAYLRMTEQTSREEVRRGRRIAFVAGFVLLSAMTGIAAFYVHSRLGTKR